MPVLCCAVLCSQETATAFILKHAEEIMETPEFLLLSPEQLQVFVRCGMDAPSVATKLCVPSNGNSRARQPRVPHHHRAQALPWRAAMGRGARVQRGGGCRCSVRGLVP